MTRTQTLAKIAANQTRRYFEIDYYNILDRAGKLNDESAQKILDKEAAGSLYAEQTPVDKVLALWLDSAKPGHVRFLEHTLRSSLTGSVPNTIAHLSPRAARGLRKSLATGRLPTHISSPLFKWMPFIKETARGG